jgi:Uma2 family endonuclease
MLMTMDPPLPDWVIPPYEGFTAEDLDRLQGLPPHTELIDGSLVFVSPQGFVHKFAVLEFYRALDAVAPAGFRVTCEFDLKLAHRQRVVPDVMVITGAVRPDRRQSAFPAEDVTLVVEVVSPESEIRDRERKPQLYATAGIEHFWRVEDEDDHTVVYAHRLNHATKCYDLAGRHQGTLKLDAPFPVEIDLDAIDDYE